MERSAAISPVFGIKIRDIEDLHPYGFTYNEIACALNQLSQTRHDYDMLLESASFDEVDSFYNPGQDDVSADFILEAIVIDKFSRADRRMAAVAKTLNKHLANSEITALDPIVGNPKKTGGFAYVTVQLPFSDGQVVSVIFHAPEGDKKRIGQNDTIIAFRWLLNKRDITQVVAPEEGSEISLQTMCQRISQLVVKNSARFAATQKEAQEEQRKLENLKEQIKLAEERQQGLLDKIGASVKESDTLAAQLSNTLAKLEKQKTINAELQARLDALKRATTGGIGTAGANGNGENPAKVSKQIKYTDDSGREITYTITNVTPNGSATRNEYRISRSSFHPSTGTLSVVLFENGEWDLWSSDTWKNPLRWTPDINEAERFVEFDARQNGYTKNNADNPGTSKLGNSTNPEIGGSTGNNGGAIEPPTFVTDLQAIVAGKHDSDSAKCIELLENAINEAEKAGLMEDYETLLNDASNHLTELLAKEAA